MNLRIEDSNHSFHNFAPYSKHSDSISFGYDSPLSYCWIGQIHRHSELYLLLLLYRRYHVCVKATPRVLFSKMYFRFCASLRFSGFGRVWVVQFLLRTGGRVIPGSSSTCHYMRLYSLVGLHWSRYCNRRNTVLYANEETTQKMMRFRAPCSNKAKLRGNSGGRQY